MIGLQTDDEHGLRVLGRPAFDRVQLERCVVLLQPLSVPYVELMTGIVGDTADKLRARLDHALSLGARVTLFPLLATKGTRVYQRCLDEGAVVDPHYQYAVTELPTLSRAEYRAVIAEFIRRQRRLEPGVLEIVGYDFLFPREPDRPAPQAAPPARAAEPEGEDVEAVVAEVLGRFERLDTAARVIYRLGDWIVASKPEPGRHADLVAVKLTFRDGPKQVCIDAFRIVAFTSPPLAQGERLAFVPSLGSPAPREIEDQEAVRHLCLALAAFDRPAPDEGASAPASR